MRIGFFTDSYFPEIDGVTYTVKTWKERLEERGHEVYIIYPDSSDYNPEDGEIPVRSVPNPFYSGYNLPLPQRLRKFPEDLDIVHCHSPATLGLEGRLYAEFHGIPSVYSHHTPVEEYFVNAVKSEKVAGLLGKIYVPLENLFLRRFDRFLSNTDSPARDVETEKLPAGIDMEFFQPQKDCFLEREDPEKPVIGYSGRISPEKNVGDILRLAESSDYQFVIVGEGPLREKLEAEAPENVSFMDFLDREKLPEFYTAIDVFVTASTGDTLGLSTLEANACGTPVVAANTYPFNTTISSQQGERFETGNIEDMKEKVGNALENEYNTREAVQKYSVEKTIDRLEDIYAELNQSGD